MQNLPPAYKEFLRADPGHILYSVDLAQAENRCVAYFAPDVNMIQAFENKIDLHMQTAALIFGKKISDISDDPGSSTLGGGKYSERFWGKKANHGLNYDLGYKAFALLYEIPENEAKFIVERYHQAYPGVRQWHNLIRETLSKGRRLTNPLGRTRIFFDQWGDKLFKEAYSFWPQSTVADITNSTLAEAYEEFPEVDFLNNVHDSLVFQISQDVPIEQHFEVLLFIQKLLERELIVPWNGLVFRIPADFSIGLTCDKDWQVKLKLDSCEDIQKTFAEASKITRESILEKKNKKKNIPIIEEEEINELLEQLDEEE